MKTMQITLFLDPSGDRALPFGAGLERYQRLADELGRYAGTNVPILKNVLANAPADGFVLLAGSGDLLRSLSNYDSPTVARIIARTVLLDVSWQRALEQLEGHRLAGAVDSLRLSEWLARPSSCAGPFGLRYLADSLGASCVPLPPLRSQHYCLLQSTWHRGMPHLLADYLTAYDRDLQPLSAVRSVTLARAWGAPAGEPAAVGSSSTAYDDQLAPGSGVEYVSAEPGRIVAALKQARDLTGRSVSQVAECSSLDLESLDRLEAGDYHWTTLGMLRRYALAMEPEWGWRLVESPTIPATRRTEAVENHGAASLSVDRPRLVVERGMTAWSDRRIRRRKAEAEFGAPSPQDYEEKLHAGV
jgi:hypothetical protein